MTAVEAFTGIRYGRGLAACMAGLCCGAESMAATMTGASLALNAASCAVTAVTCLLAAAYLSRVQVALNHGGIAFRAGLGRWQRFAWDAITTIEHADVSTSAVFGIGLSQTAATMRHIVGPGAALHLHTRTGADAWVSVPNSLTLARLQTYRRHTTE